MRHRIDCAWPSAQIILPETNYLLGRIERAEDSDKEETLAALGILCRESDDVVCASLETVNGIEILSVDSICCGRNWRWRVHLVCVQVSLGNSNKPKVSVTSRQ